MFNLSPIYPARKSSNHKFSINHKISHDTNFRGKDVTQFCVAGGKDVAQFCVAGGKDVTQFCVARSKDVTQFCVARGKDVTQF